MEPDEGAASFGGPRLTPLLGPGNGVSGCRVTLATSLSHTPPVPGPAYSPRPRVFVGSSAEGLAIAKSLQLLLDWTCEVEVWDQGVFEAGGMSLPSLIEAAHRFDFAIFVVSPDDVTDSRGTSKSTPRDNVIFELGLFMGTVGPRRSFMIYERNTKPGLPSDLAGVTAVTFNMQRSGNLRASLGAAATTIEERISRIGPLPTAQQGAVDDSRDAPTARLPGRTDAGPSPVGQVRTETQEDVALLVERWARYQPHNELTIRAALDGLRDLGYTITLPTT